LKTYEIKHLETGNVLSTIGAEGFSVSESGIVTFYDNEEKPVAPVYRGTGGPNTVKSKTTVAVTQVSTATLIIERPSIKLAPVVPITHHQV
jgi:hypothetical protein